MTYEVIRERWKHLEPDEIEKKVEHAQLNKKLSRQKRKTKHIGMNCSVRNRCQVCYGRWPTKKDAKRYGICPHCGIQIIMAEREGKTRWWALKDSDKLEIMKNQEPQLLVIK